MMQLKHNQATHISCLVTGDRFYLKNDKTKKVWELRYHTTIKVKTGYKKYSECVAGKTKKRFDANRVVFFLRRTKPVIKRTPEFSIDRYFA